MSKGALLFAFNNETTDYYRGAVYAAKRINHFLNLPVTLITDKNTVLNRNSSYNFDNVLLVESDQNNTLKRKTWINKGRYRAYELSPYDETLLLDVDYIVSSPQLLKLFDMNSDFMCHNSIRYLLTNIVSEQMSKESFDTLWATVIKFNKTKRSEQIFNTLRRVQHNYEFYSQIHKFPTIPYRNDYGLTLAHRIVNGHYDEQKDYIPWSLLHVGHELHIRQIADSDKVHDTIFRIRRDNGYIKIKDTDIHILHKRSFMNIVNNNRWTEDS